MGCCGNWKDKRGEEGRAAVGRCYLCRLMRALCRPKDLGGDPCVVIPGHLIRRPDPCIYSQFLLMQLNKPVTWDNPDVRILLAGTEQDTYNLVADTEYDVEITVHNSSRDKPANNTAVEVEWIEFGAGAQIRHPIANLVANVPIWPATAVVATKWRTPATPGHFCIEVDLAHPDDGNPANNRGWNNTQVHAANSPVDRTVRIFNAHPRGCPKPPEGGGPYLDARRALWGWGPLAAFGALLYGHVRHGDSVAMNFGVTMLAVYILAVLLGLAWYRIHNNRLRPHPDQRATNPDRTDCHLVTIDLDSHVFEDRVGKDFDPDTIFAPHPPDWPAHVDPAMFVFAEGEAYRDVRFHADAPDGPGPPANFNLNVRQGGEPTGGVTITVTRGG